jgi:hypothetical protein
VLANAALVSMTARSSLEMTEPAWQYDAYHDTWAVMAAEFDLHERHAAFGTKVRGFAASSELRRRRA